MLRIRPGSRTACGSTPSLRALRVVGQLDQRGGQYARLARRDVRVMGEMDNRPADMHSRAGLADHHLIRADQLGRERLLDPRRRSR